MICECKCQYKDFIIKFENVLPSINWIGHYSCAWAELNHHQCVEQTWACINLSIKQFLVDVSDGSWLLVWWNMSSGSVVGEFIFGLLNTSYALVLNQLNINALWSQIKTSD